MQNKCLLPHTVAGPVERKERVGLCPSSTTFIAGIYFLGLQMACKCKINGETLIF